MGNILVAGFSSAYRTESDKELCRELDALEKRKQVGEALRPEDRILLRGQPCEGDRQAVS